MREIKFRFWHQNEKVMTDWLCAMQTAFNLRSVADQHSATNIFEPFLYRLLTSPDIIPLQFTGCYDDQRNPIFEGDIMEIELSEKRAFTDGQREIFRIRIYYGTDCFYGSREDDSCHRNYSINFGGSAVLKRRVIGNIYENPDLLPKTEKPPGP